MKYSLCLIAAGVFALFLAQSALADTTSASTPLRHLVYSVNYGSTSSTTVHNSGFSNDGNGGGSGSGVETARAHNGATGTLTVDVQREQPDKGIVLLVSESADNPEHRTKPTTCVVYGNTSAICDPNGNVEPEAIELVRVLGANFIDPSLLDANKHWHLSSTTPDASSVSDFTITHNADGVMSISEDRHITYTGSHRGTAESTSTIGYDYNRTLPTAVHAQVTGRVQQGNDYRDIKSEVVLTLVSDSLATKTAAH